MHSEYCGNLKSVTTKWELVRLGLALQTIRQTHLNLSECKPKANLLKEWAVFDSYRFASMENGI